MANPPPSSFAKWRDYFRSINTDIFNIIEHAIMVAANDFPYDFKMKRDRITEVLYASKMTKCVGCENIELAVPAKADDVVVAGLVKSDKEDGEFDKSGVDVVGIENKDTPESKMNHEKIDKITKDNDDDEDHEDLAQMIENHANMYSYGEAEALNNEIEEESQQFNEVVRIKGVIGGSEEVSEEVLLDSLRRLQLMDLSVETLKATEIGLSVNGYLRRHKSKEIRNLAKTLVDDWKLLVEQWVEATADIADKAESGSADKTPDGEEDCGLPSPPLDEGAFFTTPNSLELSKFFDAMDDDLNFQIGGEFDKNHKSGIKPPQEKRDNTFARPKDRKPEPKRNQEEALLKKQAPTYQQNKPQSVLRRKPPTGESGLRRPKPALQPKANNIENKAVPPKSDKGTAVFKKPAPPPQREKLNDKNEVSVQVRLEAAKRKLHERYQEADKAKKQRTVQVVELRDLPKQNLKQNIQHPRPAGGGQNRQRANTRR